MEKCFSADGKVFYRIPYIPVFEIFVYGGSPGAAGLDFNTTHQFLHQILTLFNIGLVS